MNIYAYALIVKSCIRRQIANVVAGISEEGGLRNRMNPLTKICEIINKWEEIEGGDINKNEYKLVGEFMDDLNSLRKLMEDKMKSCCVGNKIRVF